MASQAFKFEKTEQAEHKIVQNLSDSVLLENGLWFIRLRWVAVAIFILAGVCSQFAPTLLDTFGLTLSTPRFYAIGIYLFINNASFFFAYRMLQARSGGPHPCKLLYGQIFLDLITISYLVHHIGSTHTPVAFIYTLHIALACVFFDSRSSLLITITSSLLFLSCILLEQLGPLSTETIFTDIHINYSGLQLCVIVPATIAVFVSVWYLISHLSRMIRKRERELLEAQQRLIDTQKEKEDYAKHTTHQLKSPLDCMRSNLSLVLEGYVGTVDEKASDMLMKVQTNAEELGQTIIEELQLSRLKTGSILDNSFAPVELHTILKKCILEVEASASKRGITFNAGISDCTIQANTQQLRLLLNNLLSNAINYSNNDMPIDIVAEMVHVNGAAFARVQVKDYGIGIQEDKIPHIFDEYFKTVEAVKHNAASSGVGLAIVKKVAEHHNIEITVESTPNKGTSFELRIPAENGNDGGQAE